MIPYFIFTKHVNNALFTSIGITAVILLIFGYTKAKLTGTGQKDALFGALQTLMIGAVAAGTAYGIVRGLNNAQAV